MAKYINENEVNNLTAIPLIGGVAYNFASITLSVAGVIFKGFTDISYGVNQQVDNIYGAGGTVHARSYGNKTFENCSITLTLKEVHALRLQAIVLGGSQLTDLPPFEIIVTYIPTVGGTPIVDVIKNCSFLSDSVSASQNAPSITVALPFLPSDIVRA